MCACWPPRRVQQTPARPSSGSAARWTYRLTMALRTMRVIFTGPAAMRSRRLAIPSIRASSRRAMLNFFLKHRNEPRGIGGIFYDDFSELGFESGCAMMQNVGAAFLDAYLPIIE